MTVPKRSQRSDFKINLLNVLEVLREMWTKNKRKLKKSAKNGDRIVTENPTVTLEFRDTITKIQQVLGFRNRLEMAEERLRDIEYKIFEIIEPA